MQNKSNFGFSNNSYKFICKKLGKRKYNNCIKLQRLKVLHVVENILGASYILYNKKIAEQEKINLVKNFVFKRISRKLPANGQRTQTNAKSQKYKNIPVLLRKNNKKKQKKNNENKKIL